MMNETAFENIVAHFRSIDESNSEPYANDLELAQSIGMLAADEIEKRDAEIERLRCRLEVAELYADLVEHPDEQELRDKRETIGHLLDEIRHLKRERELVRSDNE